MSFKTWACIQGVKLVVQAHQALSRGIRYPVPVGLLVSLQRLAWLGGDWPMQSPLPVTDCIVNLLCLSVATCMLECQRNQHSSPLLQSPHNAVGVVSRPTQQALVRLGFEAFKTK